MLSLFFERELSEIGRLTGWCAHQIELVTCPFRHHFPFSPNRKPVSITISHSILFRKKTIPKQTHNQRERSPRKISGFEMRGNIAVSGFLGMTRRKTWIAHLTGYRFLPTASFRGRFQIETKKLFDLMYLCLVYDQSRTHLVPDSNLLYPPAPVVPLWCPCSALVVLL